MPSFVLLLEQQEFVYFCLAGMKMAPIFLLRLVSSKTDSDCYVHVFLVVVIDKEEFSSIKCHLFFVLQG